MKSLAWCALFLLACGDAVEAPDASTDAGSIEDVGADGGSDVSLVDASDARTPDADETDASVPPWRSVLYPDDWTPEFTGPGGAFLHDFSYAGAFNGEDPLPDREGALFDVHDFGAAPGDGDSGPAFQAAIDAASVDGGVVWVPAGTYHVAGTLRVGASNVVVRGEGSSSRVYFSQVEGMTGRAHLLFSGRGSEGTRAPLVP